MGQHQNAGEAQRAGLPGQDRPAALRQRRLRPEPGRPSGPGNSPCLLLTLRSVVRQLWLLDRVCISSQVWLQPLGLLLLLRLNRWVSSRLAGVGAEAHQAQSTLALDLWYLRY